VSASTCNGGETLKKSSGALRLLSCSILNNILGDSRLLSGRTPLPFRALRHRFLWRQRAPITPGEIRRIERWLATARVFLAISALVAVLWIESLAFHLGFFTWAGRLLLQHNLPMLRVAPADFEPQRLFMRSMYLLVMGLLLGYLAEQQKQLRAEKAVVARVLGKARV